MEALKDPKTKGQGKKLLACVATALLGTHINSVTITGTGITLGIPSEDGDHSDTPLEEVASLFERMIVMQCIMRQLYQPPRTWTRAHLDHARREMRPYTAHAVAAFGTGISQGPPATAPLSDVVSAQIALAQHCQLPPPTDPKIKVCHTLVAHIHHALRCLRPRVGAPWPSRGCKTVGHMVGP